MTKLPLIVLIAFAFAIGGCSEESSSAEGGNSESAPQTQYTPPTPGAYGSDPRLDELYDECEGGNEGACEDLYMESPVGSEYESFAMENSDVNEPEIPSSDIQNMADIECQLQKATEGMSATEVDAYTDELVDEVIASEENISIGDILTERGITC